MSEWHTFSIHRGKRKVGILKTRDCYLKIGNKKYKYRDIR